MKLTILKTIPSKQPLQYCKTCDYHYRKYFSGKNHNCPYCRNEVITKFD